MCCSTGKNERKYFLLSLLFYSVGFAGIICSYLHREIDGSVHDLWALILIGGIILFALGFICEGAMRFYNDKEGDGFYSRWGF